LAALALTASVSEGAILATRWAIRIPISSSLVR
jgi:hypothetical protein